MGAGEAKPSPRTIDVPCRGGRPGPRLTGVFKSAPDCRCTASTLCGSPPSFVVGLVFPLLSSSWAMAAFTSSFCVLPSTSSAVNIISSASRSRSGWNSSQLLSSLGLYPSLAWLAAAADEELLYRGLGVDTGGTYLSGRSLRSRVCMADLVTVGVSASSSLVSPSNVLVALDRARGAVSARELRVLVSRGVAAPSAPSSHCSPTPSPPAINLRRLFGGSVVGSRRVLTRDLAGVRVGRRGDCSVKAMLTAEGAMVSRMVWYRKWCYKLQVGTGASLWCVSRRRCCTARAWLCAGEVVSLNWQAAANYTCAVVACNRVCSLESRGVVVLFTGRPAATLS
jgi:hypothetical protein